MVEEAPLLERAREHGAAPPHDTESAAEMYAGDPPTHVFRYCEGDLP